MVNLELLAICTALHVIFDESTHTWPPVVGPECVIGFEFAGMSSIWNIMVLSDNFPSDFKIFRYIAFVAIEKDGFIIDVVNCPVREISLGFR